jgi:iron-sulfur cluster insertion protein
MNTVTEIQDPLLFTDSAANKVKQLIEEEGNADLKLRVFVTGGGCSGFQYGFTFDEVVNEDDTVMNKNGVQLLIDPMSFQYLVGAEIDYTEGLEGSQFVIKNPNATTTCGCGSSFSYKRLEVVVKTEACARFVFRRIDRTHTHGCFALVTAGRLLGFRCRACCASQAKAMASIQSAAIPRASVFWMRHCGRACCRCATSAALCAPPPHR